eukprot:SAG22_NODE_234_length_14360_cov_13.245915_1_plen_79_part_00
MCAGIVGPRGGARAARACVFLRDCCCYGCTVAAGPSGRLPVRRMEGVTLRRMEGVTPYIIEVVHPQVTPTSKSPVTPR